MIYFNLLSLNESRLYGVGVFLRNLITFSPLEDWLDDKHITFIYHADLDIRNMFNLDFLGSRIILNPIRGINKKMSRIFFEQFILPFRLKSGDLIYSPNNINPIFLPLGVISIITIHDLLPFSRDNRFGFFQLAYLRLFTYLSTLRASKVFTVSNYSKSEIVRLLGVDKHKIEVFYNFTSTPNLISSDVEVCEPFFLSLASIHEDKQIDCSIRALKILADNNISCYLYVAGRDFGHQKKLEELVAASDLFGRVIFLGFIDDEIKWSLLRNAAGLILLGKNEGFGIPVIEAMAVGTPSIVANAGALPEIVADNGVVVNPLDATQIASAMSSYLSSPPCRSLVKQGLLRFDPRKNAFSFWKSLVSSCNN